MEQMPSMDFSSLRSNVTPAPIRSTPRFDARAMTPGVVDPSMMGRPASTPQEQPDVLKMMGVNFPQHEGGFWGGVRGQTGGIGPAMVAAFGEASRQTAPWEYTNPGGKGAEAFNAVNAQQRGYAQEDKRLEREAELKAMSDPQIQGAYNDQITGKMNFQKSLALRNETNTNTNFYTNLVRQHVMASDGSPESVAAAYAEANRQFQEYNEGLWKIRGTSTLNTNMTSPWGNVAEKFLGIPFSTTSNEAKAPMYAPKQKAAKKEERITVRRKSDGMEGTIAPNKFNDQIYERVK